MIIDAHLHLNSIDGSYDKAYRKLLLDMRANRIDKCFIIADNVVGSGCADVDTALKYANDNCLVIGSPNILMPNHEEHDKLDNLLAEKKIIGLKFFPGHDAYHADDERCNKYFELAIKHDCPVIFHTGINTGDTECAKYNDPKLIVSVAKRYPDLKIIISHYYWPKMDYCYEVTRGYFNIHFDTSAMSDPEVVEMSGGIEKVRTVLEKTIKDNPKSVIFGTDYSMCDTHKNIELIDSLNISDDTKKMVRSENAMSLFNIKRK
jgi:predicted TIM-barrel fold metal-dependent hydrolase